MFKVSKRPIVLLIKAKRHFALESRFSFIFFCIFKSFWTVQRTDLFHLLFIINLSSYCFVSNYFYQNDKIKSQSLIYAWSKYINSWNYITLITNLVWNEFSCISFLVLITLLTDLLFKSAYLYKNVICIKKVSRFGKPHSCGFTKLSSSYLVCCC